MKYLITILLTISSGSIFCQQAPAGFDSVIMRMGREFTEDSLTGNLSIGITYKGAEWFYNFGRQDPSRYSIYEIGSITKTFVSMIMAHAVTEGKVSPQDDIRRFLPRAFPDLQYNGHPVRLIHLANSSSGLPDNLPALPDTFHNTPPESVSFVRAEIESKFSSTDFFNALGRVRPDTIPGVKPKHSNAAAYLLTYIMEKVYNEPIDRLVKRYVLDPLNMRATTFGTKNVNPRMMQGHTASNHPAPLLNWELVQGIGSMRSSTADMVKYLQYLMAQKTPEATMVLLPVIAVDAATNKTIELYPKDTVDARRYSISYNWIHYHPGAGERRVFTDGGTPGFRSFIIMYTEADIGMIFLTDRTGPEIYNRMYGIIDRIFRIAKR
jgi:D-alanyl-D-alanine-carboxypeptidase/D-alanyl-D-alanine-endopeptidase